MYYYYFNLHLMHVFYIYISIIMFYVIPFIIYYYYFFILYIYICIFQNEDEKDNKKNTFIYLYWYIFICRNKNTWIKILSNAMFLCIHELCDPSNPSHLTYTLSPFLRSTFSTRYTSGWVARCNSCSLQRRIFRDNPRVDRLRDWYTVS